MTNLSCPSPSPPLRHREIVHPSLLYRPPRYHEGMRPPAGWVINSPFVFPKCSRWIQEHAPTPSHCLALPTAPCRGRAGRAPASACHMVARPKQAFVLRYRPTVGEGCWLLFPAGEEDAQIQNPRQPLPRVSLVRGRVGLPFCVLFLRQE